MKRGEIVPEILLLLYMVHVPKFLVLAYTSLKYKKGLKQPKNTDRKGLEVIALKEHVLDCHW